MDESDTPLVFSYFTDIGRPVIGAAIGLYMLAELVGLIGIVPVSAITGLIAGPLCIRWIARGLNHYDGGRRALEPTADDPEQRR